MRSEVREAGEGGAEGEDEHGDEQPQQNSARMDPPAPTHRAGCGYGLEPRGPDETGTRMKVRRLVGGLRAQWDREGCVPAGLVGALGWATFLALHRSGLSPTSSTAAAAVVVGIAGNVLAGRHRPHPLLYVVPGIMPLVPRLALYPAILDLYTTQRGANALLQAFAMGLAIAAGVTLGNLIIRPLRRPVTR